MLISILLGMLIMIIMTVTVKNTMMTMMMIPGVREHIPVQDRDSFIYTLRVGGGRRGGGDMT